MKDVSQVLPTGAAAPACVDTQTAAALVGLSPHTLEYFRRNGSGPVFLKLGRCVRYRPADLDAWLISRAQPFPRVAP